MAAMLFAVVIGRTPTQLLTELEKKSREFLVCSAFIKITRIFDPRGPIAVELIEWKSRDIEVHSITQKTSKFSSSTRLCNVAV